MFPGLYRVPQLTYSVGWPTIASRPWNPNSRIEVMSSETLSPQDSPDDRLQLMVQHRFGTASLVVGAGLFGLLLGDAANILPFHLPDLLYRNQPLWWLFAVIAMVIGFGLLANRRVIRNHWSPDRPGQRFSHLVLYTREGCHLCEDAHDILYRYARYLPEIDEKDIDTEPNLQQRLGKCVPVVEIDGKVRFRGKLNEALLRRLIEATPPH